MLFLTIRLTNLGLDSIFGLYLFACAVTLSLSFSFLTQKLSFFFHSFQFYEFNQSYFFIRTLVSNFSNQKSPTNFSLWELALVALCRSLSCKRLLFEWIKSTGLGLECSRPQKSVHYIPEHMFYCSATLPGHWNSRKNRSEEPLAVARCGARGRGFNSEEVSLLYTCFAMR